VPPRLILPTSDVIDTHINASSMAIGWVNRSRTGVDEVRMSGGSAVL
jgi:hypothetical protein